MSTEKREGTKPMGTKHVGIRFVGIKLIRRTAVRLYAFAPVESKRYMGYH